MALFFRDGREFSGTPRQASTGRFFTTVQDTCGRCGGAGGWQGWPDFTCFGCGGTGRAKPRDVTLFSVEQLGKLNARDERKRAAKQAKWQAEQEAAIRERDARTPEFLREHGALLARADKFLDRSDFVRDVATKARVNVSLTPGQRDALEAAVTRFEANDARQAANVATSRHVGTVGERRMFTVRAERVFSVATQFGTMHIVTMRDADGNAIVAKGSFVPRTADCNQGKWTCTDETFTVKATVKAHETFRDEKQTQVNRVKDEEMAA